MANHLTHPVKARRNEVVILAFRINSPDSGSPVLAAGHGQQGVTLTKPSTGVVRVTLAESYNHILSVTATKIFGPTPAAGYWRVANNPSGTDGKTFDLVHATDAAPGSASNPEANSAIYVTVVCRNSAAA